MSIGPRRIPKKGENYHPLKKKYKNKDDIWDYLPWFFIIKGWFS